MIFEVTGPIQVRALPRADEAAPGLPGLVSAGERVLEREGDAVADGQRPGVGELSLRHFTKHGSLLPRDVDDCRRQVDEILPAEVAGLVEQDIDGMAHLAMIWAARNGASVVGGLTQRLHRARAGAGTAQELLARLGRPDLAERIPPGISVDHLLEESQHEAALLRHPYVSPDHVILAVTRLVDQKAYADRWDRLAGQLLAAERRRWLIPRPLGRHSAARPEGQHELERLHQEAIRAETIA